MPRTRSGLFRSDVGLIQMLQHAAFRGLCVFSLPNICAVAANVTLSPHQVTMGPYTDRDPDPSRRNPHGWTFLAGASHQRGTVVGPPPHQRRELPWRAARVAMNVLGPPGAGD